MRRETIAVADTSASVVVPGQRHGGLPAADRDLRSDELEGNSASSSAPAASGACQQQPRRGHGRRNGGPLPPTGLEGGSDRRTLDGDTFNQLSTCAGSPLGCDSDLNPLPLDAAAPRDAARPRVGGGDNGGIRAAGLAVRLAATCGGGAASQRGMDAVEVDTCADAAADAFGVRGNGHPHAEPCEAQQPAKRRRIRGKQPTFYLGTAGRGVQLELAGPSVCGDGLPAAPGDAASSSGGRPSASSAAQPALHAHGTAVPNSAGGIAASCSSSRFCALTLTTDRSPGQANRDEQRLTVQLGVHACGRPPESRG